MRIKTWCGSVIETREYSWRIWYRWALGWIRGWHRFDVRRRTGLSALLLTLLAAGIVFAQVAPAHYDHHDHSVLLPDRSVTPGKVRTIDAIEVCHGGSTKQYRHTTAQEKAQVYKWYAAVKKRNVCCEVDHLISLELGGADEVENLWPQPYLPRPGAHEKDEVENWLHEQVCTGKMSLGEAQAEIATDWYSVYLKMPKAGGH